MFILPIFIWITSLSPKNSTTQNVFKSSRLITLPSFRWLKGSVQLIVVVSIDRGDKLLIRHRVTTRISAAVTQICNMCEKGIAAGGRVTKSKTFWGLNGRLLYFSPSMENKKTVKPHPCLNTIWKFWAKIFKKIYICLFWYLATFDRYTFQYTIVHRLSE